MLEFCKCGSLIVDNQCTNKRCPSKISEKSGPTVQKKATGTKSPRSKRASKVITYNLYDIEEEE